ncbi:hypothetical protein BDF14DRAFT_1864483 [Spinellus fusiger]|nr:hypothetical protein BDF14DRAFT_1864483 [Spinellus fusiger]
MTTTNFASFIYLKNPTALTDRNFPKTEYDPALVDVVMACVPICILIIRQTHANIEIRCINKGTVLKVIYIIYFSFYNPLISCIITPFIIPSYRVAN